jgi:hypothetical protein
MEDIPDSREMRVVFFCKGKLAQYFDIKQMICHMLGVANEMLNANSKKPVLFLYLLFNPCNLNLSEEYATEILGIYQDTCWTANSYEFEEMYGHIVDYLVYEHKIPVS